jgi:hypothetical protein
VPFSLAGTSLSMYLSAAKCPSARSITCEEQITTTWKIKAQAIAQKGSKKL